MLVTGAAGQLAQALIRELRAAGHDVRPYTRAALDITRGSDVRHVFEQDRPDVVLNCSAYNRVDDAELNRDLAFAINGEGPGILAREAEQLGSVFVHYSTDFVFDGETSRPYGELDQAAPASVYGQSKLAGEVSAAHASRHYVLRLESLFGRQPGGQSTIDWLTRCLLHGREAPVFVDRVVSPSYSPDVARATRHLLECAADPGVYHCVNSGHTTWYQLAEEVARQLGVTPALKAVRTTDVVCAAPRPRFCALSNARLRATGFTMPTWPAALQRHLASLAPGVATRGAAGVAAVQRSAVAFAPERS
jgi:dTDP-4-dehydrorhamnose reductase